MHGYGIARRIEQISRGVFKVNPGSLLTALQRLDRAGLARRRVAADRELAAGQVLPPHPRRPQAARGRDRRLVPPGLRGRAPAQGGGVSLWLWRQLARGLRALTRPARRRPRRHRRGAALPRAGHRGALARGLSRRRGAPRGPTRAGNVTSLREEVRSYGWENAVDTLPADLRFAARRLRSEPGFTAVTAAHPGARASAPPRPSSARSTRSCSSPCHIPTPAASSMLWDQAPTASRADDHFGTYREVAERTPLVRVVRGVQALAADAAGAGRARAARWPARQRRRTSVSLGVPPALGRDFQAGRRPARRAQRGHPRATGSGAAASGPTRRSSGGRSRSTSDPYIVVGVMPAGFENVLAPGGRALGAAAVRHGGGPRRGVIISRHGGTAPARRGSSRRRGRELDAMAAYAGARVPAAGVGRAPGRLHRGRLQDDVTRGVKPALLAILGAVVLLLAIACVNVTNLLLARGVQRRGEFALRAALGAGRGRLVRQLLTESLLLAVARRRCSGWPSRSLGVRALVALARRACRGSTRSAWTARCSRSGLAITTLIGLAFGLAPALQARKRTPQAALQHGTRRATGGQRRARSALVVAEVALALVLLVSSGLLLRSLGRLFAVEAGFDAIGLLTMQVQTVGPSLRRRRRHATSLLRGGARGGAAGARRHRGGVHQPAAAQRRPRSVRRALRSPARRTIRRSERARSATPSARATSRPCGFRSGAAGCSRSRTAAGAPLVALISESHGAAAAPGLRPDRPAAPDRRAPMARCIPSSAWWAT